MVYNLFFDIISELHMIASFWNLNIYISCCVTHPSFQVHVYMYCRTFSHKRLMYQKSLQHVDEWDQ